MAKFLVDEAVSLMEEKLVRLERDLKRRCIYDMMNAGADVLIESWKNVIQEKRHVRSEAMYRSVAKTDVMEEVDGASIEVYPMGTDKHRINNAQKAFILHYGREAKKNGRKGIKGDKFVNTAEKRSKERVAAVMQEVLNRYISGKD